MFVLSICRRVSECLEARQIRISSARRLRSFCVTRLLTIVFQPTCCFWFAVPVRRLRSAVCMLNPAATYVLPGTIWVPSSCWIILLLPCCNQGFKYIFSLQTLSLLVVLWCRIVYFCGSNTLHQKCAVRLHFHRRLQQLQYCSLTCQSRGVIVPLSQLCRSVTCPPFLQR